MEVLNALRNDTIQDKPYQYWNSDQLCENLNQATHVELSNNVKYLLTENTGFKASKGIFPLKSILYVWETRQSPFSDYLTGAIPLSVITASVLERTELLEWLKGTKNQCSYLETITTKRTQDDRLTGKSLDDHEYVKKIRLNEYTLRTRTMYLTPAGNKQFGHVRQLCYDVFLRNKPPPIPHATQVANANKQKLSKTSSRLTSSKRNASSNTDPIIIVPPGFGTLLNMLTVKSFLESGIFMTTEEAREKGLKKSNHLELTRKATAGGNKKSWKLTILDNVDSLSNEDWDRVIAVFAGGMAWQFTGWKWSNPVELFSKVRGYHVKYEGENTPPLISQWNVRVLPVHRTKRHLDQPLILDFWADLEKWVLANKPHLL